MVELKLLEFIELTGCQPAGHHAGYVSRETTATYGTRRPLAGSAGGRRVAKEQTSVGQHDRDHIGSFTQVRATARRKTLLLLWWIDGGKGGVGAYYTCPTRVALGRQRLRVYGGVSYSTF